MTTDIYLDGEKLEYEDAGGDSTVKELVEALEKELHGVRRCITEIWVNGENVAEWMSEAVLGKRISEHSELKLKTASVEALALEGIDILHEYIRFIKENITSCSTDLRMGRPSAESLFAAIFEGLVEVLKTAEALTRGAGRYRIDLFKEAPAVFYKPLMERLDELNSARSARDTVLMADILEHELVPLITGMEEKVFTGYAT